MASLSFAAALDTAMAEEMRRDEKVYTMSTAPSPALLQELGESRVRRMPISEATMTGIAVGSAGCGFRPVVHWRSVTFAFMAFDQVVNQACKIRYMFGGQRDFPIVFRASYLNGSRSAAQHSQTGYALYAHLAGLKVVLPSGAADARGLLKSAIRDNNPVVCFEPARIDPMVEDVPDDEGLVPIGVAAVKRPGTDVTVVALGYMVYPALAAAEKLAKEGGQADHRGRVGADLLDGVGDRGGGGRGLGDLSNAACSHQAGLHGGRADPVQPAAGGLRAAGPAEHRGGGARAAGVREVG
jgi:pyruvate/2-oxoglutarate/acetoin dehydrogenase E1 component